MAPPPTKNTAMLDLDWLILGMFPPLWSPVEKWAWLLLLPLLLKSKSGSRAVSVVTTHEAGRHFFRVYGVLTRRFIFSPEALRLPLSIRERSSEKDRREDIDDVNKLYVMSQPAPPCVGGLHVHNCRWRTGSDLPIGNSLNKCRSFVQPTGNKTSSEVKADKRRIN